MLEKLIGDLIAALNANTEAVKNGAVKTTKKEKTKDEPPASTGTSDTATTTVVTSKPAAVEEPKAPAEPVYPTQEDVIAAANALMDANGNDGKPLAPLTVKYAAKPLRNCAPEKRADLIADLKQLTADAKATPAI
jgi:hypothetical protein